MQTTTNKIPGRSRVSSPSWCNTTNDLLKGQICCTLSEYYISHSVCIRTPKWPLADPSGRIQGMSGTEDMGAKIRWS